MTAVVLVLAALAGLLHVMIFVFESLWWTRETIWRRFGVATQADADTTKPMAYNQGFYNLFLALGIFIGIGAVASGHDAVGMTLVIFCCACIVAAALVLVSGGRKYVRPAATQATFAVLALLAALVGAVA